MTPELATWIVNLGLVYAGLGMLFSIPFAWIGAGKIDPVARAGTWGFRLLILPAAAALWPWLLVRWVRGTPPPQLRTPHTAAATTNPNGDTAP